MATAVDYGVMIACVSIGSLKAMTATACGALVGSIVGFTLSRRWVFRRTDAPVYAQMVRYIGVSLLSLLANVGGEALLVGAGLHYLAARPIISVAVALAWNLPMQCLFVFAVQRRTVAPPLRPADGSV